MKNFTLTKRSIKLILLLVLFPLASFSQTVLYSETFESGTGTWTPGSNVTQSGAAPYQGTKSLRFRGTSGMTLTSPLLGINTLGYNKIDVKFFLNTTGNVGESITLQYRPNTLAAWVDVRVYTIGSAGTGLKDMNVTNTYHAFYGTIFSTTSTFSATSQFQFVANLASTSKYFYLDNLSITGTTYNTITNGPGGVTANLETWLRADKIDGTGVVADNAVVNKWEDIGKGNDASVIDATNATITNRPSYKNNSTNNINFNPVVNFNNTPAGSISDFTGLTNKAELNATSGFYTNEQYIVLVNDSPSTYGATTPSSDIFCSQSVNPYDNDGTGFGYGQYTIRMDNEVVSYCHGSSPIPNPAVNSRGYGISQSSTTATYTNAISILSSRNNTAINGQELYFNANRIDNLEVGAPQFSNFGNRSSGLEEVKYGTEALVVELQK